MMGRQTVDQSQLFYLFNLEGRIPARHLLRRINPIVTQILADLRGKLQPFYSEIGRPSIDPELMLRMLIVAYCYGIRSERKLCEEVELHLAYRWFCRLALDNEIPDHSTFSVNRHGRFRDSNIFREVFEAVVRACMDAGLVKGEGFAVDASVIEADASRYHGKAPDEIDWSAPERQTRAVAEFLTSLDNADVDRKPPKVISPVDPCSAWTAKANKRVQFGYGLNYLIDIQYAVIVDVEATPARTYDEVAATKTMIERTEQTLGLKPERLAADTAYGTGKFLQDPCKLHLATVAERTSCVRRLSVSGVQRVQSRWAPVISGNSCGRGIRGPYGKTQSLRWDGPPGSLATFSTASTQSGSRVADFAVMHNGYPSVIGSARREC